MGEGRRERVREKVRRAGLDALAPHEVVELLLYPFIPRKDTSPLARALLAEYGSLSNLFNASESELLTIPGMPKAAAFYISLINKLVGKAQSENIVKRKIENIGEALQFFFDLMSMLPVETIYILCLDAKRKVIKVQKICEGLATEVDVNLRMVAEAAIQTRATYIILAHNHPSGEIVPSACDIKATEVTSRFLENLGVKLIDHIIVGKTNCVSLRREGCFPDTSRQGSHWFKDMKE